MLSAVCVFCGSNAGTEPAYAEAARELGALIARRGSTLVYGGGNVGLMGILADAALAAGGPVVGVIPQALAAREVAHAGLTELQIVETMHERKAAMAGLAQAFIAMPGGIGTLEEFFEVWTWAQLGVHHKPCALLNTDGFFDPLLAFLDQAVERGFLDPKHRAMVLVDTEPARLLERLEGYQPPVASKWLDREKT